MDAIQQGQIKVVHSVFSAAQTRIYMASKCLDAITNGDDPNAVQTTFIGILDGQILEAMEIKKLVTEIGLLIAAVPSPVAQPVDGSPAYEEKVKRYEEASKKLEASNKAAAAVQEIKHDLPELNLPDPFEEEIE